MLFDTGGLTPESKLSPTLKHQIYCGLDSCLTWEVRSELRRLHNTEPEIYSFERALQAPYLEIMNRGFLVDGLSRSIAADGLRQRIAQLRLRLNRLSEPVWGKALNPRSHSQLQDFFYSKMKIPEIWLSQKGQRKLSMNREVLEKIEETHLYARPFVALILLIRDLSKQLEVLETSIDSDGRYRTSYNIAGTETGRPSSSENAFGTGGNAQNIAPSLRWTFVADPGCKLGVIDFEQVEARDVGFFCGCLFNDWSYLDSAESGDLHTNNSKLIWPELDWTGHPTADRRVADQIFYREFSYRDMAKRGGHLSNYKGTAWTASRALKVPQAIMDEFQMRYCRGRRASAKHSSIAPAFPGIAKYWDWCASEIQTTFQLTTPFGRQRHFFGKTSDETTIREAIAFLPQSTTADRTNLALWRIWRRLPEVQLLAQTYDSVTFQFREQDEVEIIPQVLGLMEVELTSPSGRSYIVPSEAKVGWNWGYHASASDVEKAEKRGQKLRLNLDGLKKWSPSTPDSRERTAPLRRIME